MSFGPSVALLRQPQATRKGVDRRTVVVDRHIDSARRGFLDRVARTLHRLAERKRRVAGHSVTFGVEDGDLMSNAKQTLSTLVVEGDDVVCSLRLCETLVSWRLPVGGLSPGLGACLSNGEHAPSRPASPANGPIIQRSCARSAPTRSPFRHYWDGLLVTTRFTRAVRSRSQISTATGTSPVGKRQIL